MSVVAVFSELSEFEIGENDCEKEGERYKCRHCPYYKSILAQSREFRYQDGADNKKNESPGKDNNHKSA